MIFFKPKPNSFTDEVCAGIYREAHTAGKHAAELIVSRSSAQYLRDGRRLWFSDPEHRGDAWVSFAPNIPFAVWARRQRLSHSVMPYGVAIYVHAFNHDLDKRRAYARAFATVLCLRGVNASAHCRED